MQRSATRPSLRPAHRPAQRPVGRRAAPVQRGVTLFGLVFWAVLIGFGAYVVVRTAPTVLEYSTIQRQVDKIAASNPSTVAEVRQAFDKQREIEYSIVSVTGKDLQITKENEKVVIGFAYDKEIPLYGPVFLVIKYEGRSRQ